MVSVEIPPSDLVVGNWLNWDAETPGGATVELRIAGMLTGSPTVGELKAKSCTCTCV